MNSKYFHRRSLLSTGTVQGKIKARANQDWSELHEGLDAGTKNSDFPVKGEDFPLTSPFIEPVRVEAGGLRGQAAAERGPLYLPVNGLTGEMRGGAAALSKAAC